MSAPGMGANDHPEASLCGMEMFMPGGKMAVGVSPMCM